MINQTSPGIFTKQTNPNALKGQAVSRYRQVYWGIMDRDHKYKREEINRVTSEAISEHPEFAADFLKGCAKMLDIKEQKC